MDESLISCQINFHKEDMELSGVFLVPSTTLGKGKGQLPPCFLMASLGTLKMRTFGIKYKQTIEKNCSKNCYQLKI